MSDNSDAILTLPFVRNKPGGRGRQFWHVKPTGDSQSDYALGHGYADLALGMAVITHDPSLVAWVITEMGRHPEWRSVELGFIRGIGDLACVTKAISAGRHSSCGCAVATAAAGSARR